MAPQVWNWMDVAVCWENFIYASFSITLKHNMQIPLSLITVFVACVCGFCSKINGVINCRIFGTENHSFQHGVRKTETWWLWLSWSVSLAISLMDVYPAQSWSWVASIHGLGWVGSEFFNFWWVGLGWVETWLRDIFNVMKYSTVC